MRCARRIYGLGDPDAYYGMLVFLEPGMRISRDTLLQRLVELQYERNDIDFKRGSFRVRGDVVEVYPSYQEEAYRIELWGDEIDSISTIDPLMGEVIEKHTARLPLSLNAWGTACFCDLTSGAGKRLPGVHELETALPSPCSRSVPELRQSLLPKIPRPPSFPA